MNFIKKKQWVSLPANIINISLKYIFSPRTFNFIVFETRLQIRKLYVCILYRFFAWLSRPPLAIMCYKNLFLIILFPLCKRIFLKRKGWNLMAIWPLNNKYPNSLPSIEVSPSPHSPSLQKFKTSYKILFLYIFFLFIVKFIFRFFVSFSLLF